MAYRYPMQQILNLKTSEKQQAEWRFALAAEQLKADEARLEELERMLDEINREMGASSQTAMRVGDLRNYQDYAEEIERHIRRQAAKVEAAQANLCECQVQLTDRMVDEKKWNRAKEKAWLDHRLSLNREEQKTLDEMAATRHRLRSDQS